ncbi:hypothetical protein J2X45_001014 [Caulobacter sp. BE264]|uniref:hypothetical protein n=1 Tax=Caulobacter sp. BE264 TaxID=2817724 RepID=UPI00286613A2|nr:hypothetical protein [Caulobacter sp. BE264]MDR7229933.1 hypothetical protein [Caulobacter sp. BE264]
MTADHACTMPKFCRVCHCRKIAKDRSTSQTYRAKHREGLNRWSDARAGIAIEDHERPMIREFRPMGISAINARKIIVSSRRAVKEGEHG